MDSFIVGPVTPSGGEYYFAALPDYYRESTDNGKSIFSVASTFKIVAIVLTAFSYEMRTISGQQVCTMAYTLTQLIKPGQKKYVSEVIDVNSDYSVIYYRVTENEVIGTHEGNLRSSTSIGGMAIYQKR